jgi:hypothetical protein
LKKIIFLFFLIHVAPSWGQQADQKKLETLWNTLSNTNSCLTGLQHIGKKSPSDSKLIVNDTKWKAIITQPKKSITPFLISKLKDTTKTQLHTCPFFRTRSNELAVYLLQHIYQKNWYDFKAFHRYKNRKTTGATDQPQAWLQAILAEEKTREILIKLWLSELKKVNNK